MTSSNEISELKRMLQHFRVTELQSLLGHLGKNKNGRKTELRARAVMLLRVKTPDMVNKIRELHRMIQVQNVKVPPPVSSIPFNNAKNPSNVMINQILASDKYTNPVGSIPLNSKMPMACHTPRVCSSISNLPLCPKLRFKKLAFYDDLFQVLQSHALVPGANPGAEYKIPFLLSAEHAAELSDSCYFSSSGEYCPMYSTQLQLRFCVLDETESQDDKFPPGLRVNVNDRCVSLPAFVPSNRMGVEAKRPSKPLDITHLAKLSPVAPNHIEIMWDSNLSYSRVYAVAVFMVRKLTADDLLRRLKEKRTLTSEYTIKLAGKLIGADDGDGQISTTNIQVSINCPLGKGRMQEPCRSLNCAHAQCFDAKLYIQMNEIKGSWSCPVCNQPAPFESLVIDEYFLNVVESLQKDVSSIELYSNGSWVPVLPKSSNEPPNKKMKTQPAYETIYLDDDFEEEGPLYGSDYKPQPQLIKRAPSHTITKDPDEIVECIDLTVSDSDSDTDFGPIGRILGRNFVNPINDDTSNESTDRSSPDCIFLVSPTPRCSSPEDDIFKTLDNITPNRVHPSERCRPTVLRRANSLSPMPLSNLLSVIQPPQISIFNAGSHSPQDFHGFPSEAAQNSGTGPWPPNAPSYPFDLVFK